jgi:HSP20 family molecular chaperone IbpA
MNNPKQPAIRIVAIRQPFAVFEPRPWRPPLNVYETDQGIKIIAELAGIGPDDLDVQVNPTNVQIRGMRQVPAPDGLRRIERMEIAGGPFQIEVPLATPVDPDSAEANYRNGLLDIWLPFARQVIQRVVVIRPGEGGTR